jgi:hypothetical protein
MHCGGGREPAGTAAARSWRLLQKPAQDGDSFLARSQQGLQRGLGTRQSGFLRFDGLASLCQFCFDFIGRRFGIDRRLQGGDLGAPRARASGSTGPARSAAASGPAGSILTAPVRTIAVTLAIGRRPKPALATGSATT